MATNFPPLVIPQGRTREHHAEDHQFMHRRVAECFYSDDYPTLQAAFDAVLGRPNVSGARGGLGSKVLYISPGTHVVTETLRIDSAENLHIFAYGATIWAGAEMDTLLRLDGIAYSTFHGLRLGSDHTVQKMLHLLYDPDITDRSTTHVKFYDLHVGGKYVTGVKVGLDGSPTQCDNVAFYAPFISGSWAPGEATLWQRGFVFGAGVYGNNLCHSLYNFAAGGHRVHVEVSATQLTLTQASLSIAECDFKINTTAFVTLDSVRSEGANQFIDGSGVASFTMMVTARNVDWQASELRDDGRWINWDKGGVLILDNVMLASPRVAPVLRMKPHVPASLLVRGLVAGGSVAAPFAEALDVSASVSVRVQGYIEMGNGGGTISQVDEYASS